MTAAEMLVASATEPEEFAGFYDAFFREVLAYLTRSTADAEAGFDLASEAFAQAFVSRSRFRGRTDAEAAAWVYRIAKRQLSAYRKRGFAQRRALEELGIERREIDYRATEEIERMAELNDLRDALRPRLAELTPERRAALALRVLEDCPFSDIATKLGVSEEAARARVSRALRQLGDAFDTPIAIKEMPT